MNYSAENIGLWSPVIQLGIIAILVLISNILRLKIPLVKKTLMPTSVLAGFLLLGFKYTGILPIDTNILDALTYHGIALGFIAMSLRVTKSDFSQGGGVRTAVNSGAIIVSSYMIQGVVGAFLVRIPVSYIMSKQEPVSLFHIGLATPCSTVIQIAMCFFCLLILKRRLRRS